MFSLKKKKTTLQLVQERTEKAVSETNQKIEQLGKETHQLYVQLTTIQELFDAIRNIPTEDQLQYQELKKIRQDWNDQAKKIEHDFKLAQGKAAGGGAVGVGAGVAVAAMGPSVAMGVATTFGVASTGTAISALSGAAATNAALAWLGGGALAAGGGGMAAGEALLTLAGPIGWAIAGVAIFGSSLAILKVKNDTKKLEELFCLISYRDQQKYKLASVELDERIVRIKKECLLLIDAIKDVQSFGTDYKKMNQEQQYKLGAYLNMMNASTQLLVNPIKALQPVFSNEVIDKYIENAKKSKSISDEDIKYILDHKELLILLANLTHDIEMDENDQKLIGKSLKGNKDFLKSINIKKKDFDEQKIMNTVMNIRTVSSLLK